jgi:predicted nuclease with RNAse H fold
MIPRGAGAVAGVDVGGRRKGFHAVALDSDGSITGRRASCDPEEIVAWCAELGTRLVAVDAPCAWSTDGRSRPAEAALKKVRIQCFSTPTREAALAHATDHFGWMLNGERLFQALAPSFPLTFAAAVSEPGSIETFPQAVACALAGQRVSAKQKGTVRRDLLRRQGLDLSLLTNIDFVDAALCAVAASYVLRGNARSYGEPQTGLIWVPDSGEYPARDLQRGELNK